MARSNPPRGSFQQLLLLAFLLITALMVGVALRSLVQFNTLMTQSQDAAARALTLSSAARSLAERSAAMERAGRQSLVLKDAVLRRNFDDAANEAKGILQRLGEYTLPDLPTAQWQDRLHVIEGLLAGPADTSMERERLLANEFRDLDQVNANLAQQVQVGIEARNNELKQRIEDERRQLVRQVLAASALAGAMALAFGYWLARPFKQLERAVVGLGQNRLDQPIDIRGPADVRRLSRQLERLRLRLTELDADKARFLRHVSHELKTPLTALREGVSLLEDGVIGPLSEGQREVAQILQQNTHTLQAQIEALLRFNAAAFEARQLNRQRVELRALIEQQIEAQRLQWQAQRVSVRVEGESRTVFVDAAKLATAVANLLSNAIRYSPPGGVIVFTLEGDSRVTHIDISDQGPGIAPAEREHVFEPFFRGQQQPAHLLRGTGIGLSMVQEYIAAHGGSVRLVPAPQGATFRIEIPNE
ncbi:MAG: HAMP domain-containing sensor histidine kinase [Variovorax sp.]